MQLYNYNINPMIWKIFQECEANPKNMLARNILKYLFINILNKIK